MTRIHGWIASSALLALLGGCTSDSSSGGTFLGIPDITTPTDRVAVPVTLTFQGVRTFLTGAGEVDADEWDEITPILKRYHETGNAYGVEYRVTPKMRPNPPLGLRITDYTVEMVVKSMTALSAMNDEIAARRGRTVGGKRVDFDAASVKVVYATPFVGGEIETLFFGRVDTGTRVYLYDHGSTSAREAAVGPDGRWRGTARVSPRKDHVYGYRVNAEGAMQYFRVDVVSRAEELLSPQAFEAARASGL